MESETCNIERLLLELKHISRYGFWEDIYGDTSIIPSTLAVGDGSVMRTTSNLESIMYSISVDIMDKYHDLMEIFANKDIYLTLRQVIGSTLADIDIDENIEATALLVKDELYSKVLLELNGSGVQQYNFGCDLFNCKVENSEIGPVSIELRSDWLSRALKEKRISKATFRRISRAWAGEKRGRKRTTFEGCVENGVLDFVKDHRYVYSVAIEGMGSVVGLQRSLLAIKIANTAIALQWRKPSAALRDFNIGYECQLFDRNYIVFTERQVQLISAEKSYKPGGRYIEANEWREIYEREKALFGFFGEVLFWLLNSNQASKRPRLSNIFAQSVFWFHEACREKLDTVAIVKFIAAMDTLAGGKGEYQILDLLSFRANISRKDRIFRDGSSVEKSLIFLYTQGRSRIIHGSTDRFKRDWTMERDKAEFLARSCILSCIDWAIANVNSDDAALMRKQ